MSKHKGLYDIDAMVEGLRQQRDMLMVQMSLAKAEVRDEWDELEKKWSHFRAKAGSVQHEVGEASKDVLSAAKLMGEEIQRGYERIRKRL